MNNTAKTKIFLCQHSVNMSDTNNSSISNCLDISRHNVTCDTDDTCTNDELLDSVHLTLIIVEAFVIMPAIIGNTLILISLFRFRCLRTAIGVLIGSLALTDLLTAGIIMPMDVIGQLSSLLSYKYFCLARTGGFIAMLGVSVLNLLVINIERFLALAYPLKHRSKMSLIMKITRWALVIIWLSMTSMGISPMIGWNTYNEHSPCTITAVFTLEYQLLFSSVYALGTIGTTVLILVVIGLVLYKLSCHSGVSPRLSGSRKLKKTYLVLAVSTSFIVCWGPYFVVTCIRLFDVNAVAGKTVRFTLVPTVINVGFNWMIYGLGNTKLRQAMTAIMKRKQHFVIAGSFSS